jgi:hypothetical protein
MRIIDFEMSRWPANTIKILPTREDSIFLKSTNLVMKNFTTNHSAPELPPDYDRVRRNEQSAESRNVANVPESFLEEPCDSDDV